MMRFAAAWNEGVAVFVLCCVFIGIVVPLGAFLYRKIKAKTGNRFVAGCVVAVFAHLAYVAYPSSAEKNPRDQIAFLQTDPEIKYLVDGEVIDLGGREIEVIFTPGHTPGSTTFFDKAAGYGFSGDAFGSGNLLLTTNYSTLLLTCQRTLEYMQKNNIEKLYPGHYMGVNVETQKRVADMLQMSRDVLDGKLEGQPNPQGMLGLNKVLSMHGVRINYADTAVK